MRDSIIYDGIYIFGNHHNRGLDDLPAWEPVLIKNVGKGKVEAYFVDKKLKAWYITTSENSFIGIETTPVSITYNNRILVDMYEASKVVDCLTRDRIPKSIKILLRYYYD